MSSLGRVETDGGRGPCCITGEGLSPATSGSLIPCRKAAVAPLGYAALL